jgi:hypothetical protein
LNKEKKVKNRTGSLLLCILFVSLLAAGVALAQKDIQGSKDHPLITRMPGYYNDTEASRAQNRRVEFVKQ